MKKFKHLNKNVPVQYFDTFEYGNQEIGTFNDVKTKTHFIIYQPSILTFGYMQKLVFNRLSIVQLKSTPTCFSIFGEKLFLGCANGSIAYTTMSAVTDQIPLSFVESINGKRILSVMEIQNSLYSIDQTSVMRKYEQSEKKQYKYVKQIILPFSVLKCLTKAPFKTIDLFPIVMILIETEKYPIFLTQKDIIQAFQNINSPKQWTNVYDKHYFEDEKPFFPITCMDFDPEKKLAVLGKANGMIQTLRISPVEVDNSSTRYVLTPEFAWNEKDTIMDVNICNCKEQTLIAFVNKFHISCLNIEKRNYPKKKINNSTDKRINCIKWTIDNNFLTSGIGQENPRLYCFSES